MQNAIPLENILENEGLWTCLKNLLLKEMCNKRLRKKIDTSEENEFVVLASVEENLTIGWREVSNAEN